MRQVFAQSQQPARRQRVGLTAHEERAQPGSLLISQCAIGALPFAIIRELHHAATRKGIEIRAGRLNRVRQIRLSRAVPAAPRWLPRRQSLTRRECHGAIEVAEGESLRGFSSEHVTLVAQRQDLGLERST
jgi:hypothetical protein